MLILTIMLVFLCVGTLIDIKDHYRVSVDKDCFICHDEFFVVLLTVS